MRPAGRRGPRRLRLQQRIRRLAPRGVPAWMRSQQLDKAVRRCDVRLHRRQRLLFRRNRIKTRRGRMTRYPCWRNDPARRSQDSRTWSVGSASQMQWLDCSSTSVFAICRRADTKCESSLSARQVRAIAGGDPPRASRAESRPDRRKRLRPELAWSRGSSRRVAIPPATSARAPPGTRARILTSVLDERLDLLDAPLRLQYRGDITAMKQAAFVTRAASALSTCFSGSSGDRSRP